MPIPSISQNHTGDNWLRVRGACTNLLQNFDVDFPLHALSVVTGASGSGKSSLAIDTIAAEGQRRYLEALTLGQRGRGNGPARPRVRFIDNLSPTVKLGQFVDGRHSRATVSTLAGLWPLFQSLAVHGGLLYCPNCQLPVVVHRPRAIVDFLLSQGERTKALVLAPLGEHSAADLNLTLQRIQRDGFVRARIDGELVDIASAGPFACSSLHQIDAVIDRILVKEGIRSRLEESIATALEFGVGNCITSVESDGIWRDHSWQTVRSCSVCRLRLPELEPQLLSWNSSQGACLRCGGHGVISESEITTRPESGRRVKRQVDCPDCAGCRLGTISRQVRIADRSVGEICHSSVRDLLHWVISVQESLLTGSSNPFVDALGRTVAERVLPELLLRLQRLNDLGLGYLTLSRSSNSLSRGERQRARLAGALGARAQGLLYVLDEPTTGLHASDIGGLVDQLRQLCLQGNTLIVVEHTPQLIALADWIVELGPDGGPRGGRLIAAGTVDELSRHPASLTGSLLQQWGQCLPPSQKEPKSAGAVSRIHVCSPETPGIRFSECRLHNLRGDLIEIPLQRIVGVAGVSGSGKTSAFFGGMLPLMEAQLRRISTCDPVCGVLEGAESLDGLLVVARSAHGRSPIASPATLCGVWQEIRKLFARTREARRLGFRAERFSYRHPESRCSVCQGGGRVLFREAGHEWWSLCPACRGRRFGRTLNSILYRGLRVADVLEMTMADAAEQFQAHPRIARLLNSALRLGLGYLTLGQSGSTLSAGELQRLQLTHALATRPAGGTLFLLDEPTSGLQVREIGLLVDALRHLTAAGHSVVAIEHSLEFLRQVDWLLEFGPGSGPEGGCLIAANIPANFRGIATATGQAFTSLVNPSSLANSSAG